VVGAIIQLNIDEDANCAAIAARVDQVDSDLGLFKTESHSDATAINGTLGAVDGDARQVDTDVQAVNASVKALPQGTTGPTGPQTVELGPSSTQQLDGIGQSEHGDLWVLMGIVVGGFVFMAALWKLWP
jgi:hypothetical protein